MAGHTVLGGRARGGGERGVEGGVGRFAAGARGMASIRRRAPASAFSRLNRFHHRISVGA